MDALTQIWAEFRRTGLVDMDQLREALQQTLREAYSEGHCDGQNAADGKDLVEFTRDIDIAWAKSQTQRKLVELKAR